jgi:hypothetical protein
MQAKNRRARLRTFSLRSAAKPALYLLGFTIAAASCAAELEDPARYTVANETKGIATGGTTPTATGGSGGGGTTAMGGTKATGGTAGPTGGAGSGMVTLEACVKTIFTECAACHSTQLKDSFGGLDLSGDAVITRMKDVVATNKGVANAPACVPGALLINSANPAESVLLKRVKGTQNCGTTMPTGTTGLTGEKLKCIEDWVMKF